MSGSALSRKSALVTGATSGIGESFARLLAREGYDLILVARDLERLHQRREELKAVNPAIEIELLRADLTIDSDIERVEKRISIGIDVLVNNAGFGLNKSFTRSTVESEKELLDVLVTTPMRLTHYALPGMTERGSGAIINVSSVAGFIASGSYSAAKSYLTVLSESLHTELKGSGVKVLALCPGFTRTEFHQRGRMKMGGLPKFLWLSADDVTLCAWRDLKKGKAVSIPGWQYKLLFVITRVMPRRIVRNVGTSMNNKRRQK
jgi:short-subunit dehydrogenase